LLAASFPDSFGVWRKGSLPQSPELLAGTTGMSVENNMLHLENNMSVENNMLHFLCQTTKYLRFSNFFLNFKHSLCNL